MSDYQHNSSPADIENQRTSEVTEVFERSGVDRNAVENADMDYVCKNGLCNQFDQEYPASLLHRTIGVPGYQCPSCKDQVYAVGSIEAEQSGASVTRQASPVADPFSPKIESPFVSRSSDTERRIAASMAATANTEEAARSTAANLVPEFGIVLTKHEPSALAYGFPPAVDALIERAKLDPIQTSTLLSKFGDLFSQINNWKNKLGAIVVNGPDDAVGIAEAKTLFEAIRDDRLNVEKRKKIIKEPYLRPSQLIDGVFKVYADEASPLEKEALAKAKTKENSEIARNEAIRAEREASLEPFVENVKAFDLRPSIMTNEAFDTILATQKELFESRKANQLRQEEEQRRRDDDAAMERVKLRRKSERQTELSSFGFVRDAEGQRYILDTLVVYDREIENDMDPSWLKRVEDLKPMAEAARLEIERKRREGEAALKAKEEKDRLERDETFRTAREKEASLLAPDKIKLGRVADAIKTIEFFETNNDKIIEILSIVKADLFNAETKLRSQIDRLP